MSLKYEGGVRKEPYYSYERKKESHVIVTALHMHELHRRYISVVPQRVTIFGMQLRFFFAKK